MGLTALSSDEITAALAGLPDWALHAGALHAAFTFPTSAAAVSFLGAVAAHAEAVDHHPDVDWRYRRVVVATTTHCAGNEVTARDTALAAHVSELAAEAGATAEPAPSRGAGTTGVPAGEAPAG